MKYSVFCLFLFSSENRDLNGLNLPTHDRKHQLRARELVSQTANHLTDMVQALSNFFTYSEQRSKIYPAECINEPMSAINIQVNLNMTTKQYTGKS